MEKMKNYKYLIIGNSAAGIGAVEGIREIDREGSLAVFSDEDFFAYSRPMITDYITDKSILGEKIFYRDEGFYKENRVDLYKNTEVKKIDFKKKEVETEERKFSFEKLFIGTGGTPIIIDIDGLRDKKQKVKKGVYTFTRIEDAELIDGELGKVKNVVILGGGLIGLKAAHTLAERGIKVSVVELSDCCLAPVLDRTASLAVQRIYESKGVKFLTKRTLKKVNGKDRISSVTLDDGRTIPAQMLIMAIGVCPRIELLKEGTVPISIKTKRGIIVDSNMRTSLDFVYAAGDAAENYDFISGNIRPLPLWPNAYYGGRIAGVNMAGKNETYNWATNMNAMDIYGLSIVSAGAFNFCREGYDVLLFQKDMESANPVYKKIVLKDNIINGFVMMNEIGTSGLLLSLMREKIDVSAFRSRLVFEDFGLQDLPLETRKKLYEKP